MLEYKTINVTSGYGGNTRQPFVEIKDERLKEPMQLSPEEALDLALNLLEAAEAAEQDAFIFEFHAQLGAEREESTSGQRSDQIGAMVLHQFRKWRDDHGQNK